MPHVRNPWIVKHVAVGFAAAAHVLGHVQVVATSASQVYPRATSKRSGGCLTLLRRAGRASAPPLSAFVAPVGSAGSAKAGTGVDAPVGRAAVPAVATVADADAPSEGVDANESGMDDDDVAVNDVAEDDVAEEGRAAMGGMYPARAGPVSHERALGGWRPLPV